MATIVRRIESFVVVDFSISPRRTALVNVDLQNFFVDTTEGGVGLVRRINDLASECRKAGILVIHTAHVLRPDGSNVGVLGEIVPDIKTEGLLNRGSKTAELHPELHVDPLDVFLEKPRFGAFYGTDLELILRSVTSTPSSSPASLRTSAATRPLGRQTLATSGFCS